LALLGQARAFEGAADAAARQLTKMTAGNEMKIRVNDFVRDGIIISLEPDRTTTLPAIRGAGSQADAAQYVGVVLPGAGHDISNYLINNP
jgi:hypothetical protein